MSTGTETPMRAPPEPRADAGSRRGAPGAPKRRAVLKTAGAVLAGVAAVAVVIAVGAAVSGGLRSPALPLIYHTVQRGDLQIKVTERGNLESQDQVKIICEVDDINGDMIHGTPILSVVPNGASVQEGDLLVELDSAGHQERLDRQILDTERARAEQIKARVQYENRKTQNETSLAEAQLTVDLADLALKQFEDEDGGTFQIEHQNIELQIQEAQAEQLIKQTDLEGVEQLYKLGYRSEGERAQAQLNALRAERQLATAVSKRKELVEYQYLKMKMQLEGQLASAKRSLEQVERDNEALLEQAKAATEAANEGFQKEEELLQRYREQVEKCRILSPANGMVAYAVSENRWGRQEIRVGVPVHPRQTLLTIPNLKRMQIKTAVHESVLDQIRAGLPVTVRVDAFPEKAYRGSVQIVAVLPDQGSWMSSDTKVYETIVTVDEEVSQLKPGMTAVVEIHVDFLRGVISVPIQAIVQVRHDNWCYVEAGGGVERRPVVLGRTNEKFIEIREGLSPGDRVVLNPTAVLDESRERGAAESPGGKTETDPPETPPARRDALTGGDEPAVQATETSSRAASSVSPVSSDDDGRPGAARSGDAPLES